MRIAGIVAEYNPLHKGHMLQIKDVKKNTGADFVVVAMSGNFVQRGETAIFDKWTRAYFALQAGADMVVELPVVYSLSCAERFAYGGVKILSSLGIDVLCFGCENDDKELLIKTSELMENETQEFKTVIKAYLDKGLSYPRARSMAITEFYPDIKDYIVKPNFILALEYLKAIKRVNENIDFYITKRVNSNHDDLESLSGSCARNRIINGGNLEEVLPDFVIERIKDEMPVTSDMMSEIILYAIRTANKDTIRQIQDVREGFEMAIMREGAKAKSLDELVGKLKSKRYTLAGVKRIMMNIALSVTQELSDKAFSDESSVYAKVLGIKNNSKMLLGEISKRTKIPVITKYQDMKLLDKNAYELIEKDIFASNVYSIMQKKNANRDFSEKIFYN